MDTPFCFIAGFAFVLRRCKQRKLGASVVARDVFLRKQLIVIKKQMLFHKPVTFFIDVFFLDRKATHADLYLP